MSSGSLIWLMKRLGEQSGVADVHPHRFRHTSAVRRLQNGANTFQVKEILGHSDLKSTMKYVHIAHLDLEEAMKRTSPVDNLRL